MANRYRSLLFVCVVFGCLFWFSITGLAQDRVGVEPGSVAQALTDVKLRERPPSKGLIFIEGPGDEIDLVRKGERVKILDKKVISKIRGFDIWVKVKKTDSPGESKEGWAYWGTKEEESENFKLERSEH